MPGGLGRQALAATGIVGEQIAEMHVAHLLGVSFQGLPGGRSRYGLRDSLRSSSRSSLHVIDQVRASVTIC